MVGGTFCASIAMYGEQEDDFGTEVAEVAGQAEELCGLSTLVSLEGQQPRHCGFLLFLHSTRPL